MHKFSTTSGKQLWYDVSDNRISLLSQEKELGTCPVVHFSTPTTIDCNKITMFTIEMTQQCNLRCSYCCYSGNYRDHRAHNGKEISYDTLRDIVDFIKKHADNNASEITVCFYGGEALLAKEKIVSLIEDLNSCYGDKIQYSLSTNGLALTESVIDWICTSQKFLVNITIDGNKEMHDKYRRTDSGSGSYDVIIKNLERFKNKYPEVYSNRVRFLATVYSWNDVRVLSDVWDDISVLENHYPVHISHIIPNFSDESREYDTWKIKNSFYEDAFEAYKLGKKGIMSECFQRLTDIIDKRNHLKLHHELKIKTCFQDLFSCFINVEGDLYACEKFCDGLNIGNVIDGFKYELAKPLLDRFTKRKNNLCSSCWAIRFCRMCMTSLNYTDDEIKFMCNMERDTIDLALRYFCELKDWERDNNNSKK